MDEFQRKRISKLSKKELELELINIEKLGNPLNLDEEAVLQELEKRKAAEKREVEAQKEVIMKVPLSKIKGNLFLMECRKQVIKGKPLTENVFRLFRDGVEKE